MGADDGSALLVLDARTNAFATTRGRGAFPLLLQAEGADPFAERARRELLATGETVRKRTVETPDSRRTVEWHLTKVFGSSGSASARSFGRRCPRWAQSPLARSGHWPRGPRGASPGGSNRGISRARSMHGRRTIRVSPLNAIKQRSSSS